MDLIMYSPRVAGAIYIDFTVVSALSVEAIAKGAGLRDGVASDIAAQRKQSRYNHCVTWAFAVEDHGRFGEDAVGLIRALAPTEPQLRSKAIAALHQSVASTLQRSSADAILSATCSSIWYSGISEVIRRWLATQPSACSFQPPPQRGVLHGASID